MFCGHYRRSKMSPFINSGHRDTTQPSASAHQHVSVNPDSITQLS
jgi:hypothetical protein